ncbi:hypothetical protein TPHA_0E00740 [Tetrapisispora phaffii CBS 4417]|uniref:Anaphase-promoting complex subunit 3 n=1 Tax=Tetrapisispora phaffii (strain ATCC 24235 / CBS 4417 / NBRC 1672 / NRRL Y-8282 / UCD 70-5) TaxID=1071381 RepID=G8BTE1_TETPH|nr:hypothetical protein TPHA_0E00740 [Tetrapisispora phaffii CBS 4417]CCE63169.1 hypothetical protein TPHA_0E00740 [Tetrapisispora phaffii CBS 4417]
MLFGTGPSLHKYNNLLNGNNDDIINENTLNNIINLNEYIQQSILQLNYDSAEFLSELLFAECKKLNDRTIYKIEAIYLYSLSLYLNENIHTAFDISKNYKHLNIGIAYVYALCSNKLNNKNINDSIRILLDFKEKINSNNSTTTTLPASNLIHFPNTATIDCLLGKLFKKNDNLKESAVYFTEALNKNPYLWEAYVELSNSRATLDLQKLYSVLIKHSQANQQQQQYNSSNILHHTHHPNRNRFNSVVKPYSTPFKSNRNNNYIINSSLKINDHPKQSLLGSNKKTITSGSILNKTNVMASTTSSNSNNNNSNNNTTSERQSSHFKVLNKNKFFSSSPSKKVLNDTSTLKTPKGKTTSTQHSNISNSNSKNNAGILNKDQASTTNSFASSDSPNSSLLLSSTKNNRSGQNSQQQQPLSISLVEIMYSFAKIMKTSSLYDSYKAIRLLNNDIPQHIRENMPWCQAQLGKLHYELVNYEVSLQYFLNLKTLQPSRVKDLEIYSTLLWHLNDKSKLSILSSELITSNPRIPETWCCLGNFLSLQKNHHEAIKAFEKATQVDPKFAYAYTLQGHEYTSSDSFDVAKRCYRKAIACDPGHYNAYYGLGMVSMKLGQYEEALLFFEKARSINPINVVLVCCGGVALEKLSYQEKALQYYELACELQPSSSLATFKRAHLLYSMGRYTLALKFFEELKHVAPDEATVHFLLGQIYSILGRKKDAIKEYTIALNLDPKGRQLIMEALEKCHTLD